MLECKYIDSFPPYVSNKLVRSNVFPHSSFAYLSIEITQQDKEFLFREFIYKIINLELKLFYLLHTLISSRCSCIRYICIMLVFTGNAFNCRSMTFSLIGTKLVMCPATCFRITHSMLVLSIGCPGIVHSIILHVTVAGAKPSHLTHPHDLYIQSSHLR